MIFQRKIMQQPGNSIIYRRLPPPINEGALWLLHDFSEKNHAATWQQYHLLAAEAADK